MDEKSRKKERKKIQVFELFSTGTVVPHFVLVVRHWRPDRAQQVRTTHTDRAQAMHDRAPL